MYTDSKLHNAQQIFSTVRTLAAFKKLHAQTVLHHMKFLRQNSMIAGILSMVNKFDWTHLRVMQVTAGAGVTLVTRYYGY